MTDEYICMKCGVDIDASGGLPFTIELNTFCYDCYKEVLENEK